MWRGTDPGALGLIAQFDKDNSTFTDYTCETVAPDEDVGTIRDVDGTPTAVVGYAGGETCAGDYTTDTAVATGPVGLSEAPGPSPWHAGSTAPPGTMRLLTVDDLGALEQVHRTIVDGAPAGTVASSEKSSPLKTTT